MNAISTAIASRRQMANPVPIDPDCRYPLCVVSHEEGLHQYEVTLDADISRVSLEGMNRFLVTVTSRNSESGATDRLYAELEINLRLEMNSVSIAGGSPYYFSVTGRSLDLEEQEIDSSIHEAVDLGLMDFRIRAGVKPSRDRNSSILFDSQACNQLKASISALLAQATHSHREVIHNAGHIFANRQDYVRQMCTSLSRHAEELANSVSAKASHCDQGLF